ncbi:MAG: hypothetical protein VKJ66_01730 [Synechococcus sp.]|nr:hypothetical protein [Synechococcus sp.]
MAERGRAPLPAPYESPWTLLGRDLRALAASGRLKILELRRRNASGDLPLPSAWPRSLAPLFWPLVLAGALALLVLLFTGLPRLFPGAPAAPPPDPAGAAATSAPLQQQKPLPSQELTGDPAPEPAPASGPGATVEAAEASSGPTLAPEPAEADPAEAPAPQPAPAEPEPPGPQTSELATPEAGASPIAAAYAADLQSLPRAPKASPLWLEAEPIASIGSLRLRLGEPYGSLEEGQREQLADLWWQRAQEEGYGRLELVDRQGRRLGQSARLGSGMILLDPHLLP